MSKEQVDILRARRFLRSREDVNTFEETLTSWQGAVTPSEAEELYLLLEDSSAQQDVLWGLLHFIEDLDQDTWLPAFVNVLPQLKSKSPEWVDTITARILNGNESRQALRVLLKDAPESRHAITTVLEDLARENDPRLQKLRENAARLLDELRT